jgi:hypothetical protein
LISTLKYGKFNPMGFGANRKHSKVGKATLRAYQASEASVKRPTQRYGSKRGAVGAGYSASMEVKTRGHVDSIDSCLVEAKNHLSNEPYPILESDAFGLKPKHHPSGG